MDRQEAMERLGRWEETELLYRDFYQASKGEDSLENVLEKWKHMPERIRWAMEPAVRLEHLSEKEHVPAKYDVSISKHPRYTPPFWHEHEFYETVYVLSGQCEIELEHTVLNLCAGDFLMLAPDYMHQINVFQDDSITLNLIIRSSTLLDIFLNAIRDKTLISRFLMSNVYGDKKYRYLLFHTGKDLNIRDHILDMYIELEEPDEYSNRIATSLTTILFAHVVRSYSDTADMSNAEHPNGDDTARIMNYILDHCADCTLEDLAGYLHFSAPYCSKFIKNMLGRSFSELLTEVRMQKAKNLLTSTPMRIEDISIQLGYSNPETLIRTFKKQTGLTPSAYRKQYHRSE